MTDLPIIYSAPMVQAMLADRKKMTRRLAHAWLKFLYAGPPPRMMKLAEPQVALAFKGHSEIQTIWPDGKAARRIAFRWTSDPLAHQLGMRPVWYAEPVVQQGDRLWVRESHWRYGRWLRADDDKFTFEPFGDEITTYSFDETPPGPRGVNRSGGHMGWWRRPAIHHPRAGSRLTLVVTAIKVEKLTDISEADAIAEGVVKIGRRWEVPGIVATPISAVDAFSSLWQHINGEDSWGLSLEVVALTFTVHQTNIDQLKVAA